MMIVIRWLIGVITQRVHGRESRSAANTSVAKAPISADYLAGWADANGMVLLDRAEFEAHCASFASLTVEQTDLDIELRVLLGDA